MQNGVADINPALPRNIEEYRARKDPAAIKAVAREMESLFAFEMIKVMREATESSSEGSLGKSTYMSMFDIELSKLFAQRGLGLQDMLLNGIKNLAEKSGNTPKLTGALENAAITGKQKSDVAESVYTNIAASTGPNGHGEVLLRSSQMDLHSHPAP